MLFPFPSEDQIHIKIKYTYKAKTKRLKGLIYSEHPNILKHIFFLFAKCFIERKQNTSTYDIGSSK